MFGKNKELAEIPQVEESAAGLVNVIARAAMNPEIDIDKMQQLLDMQERIMDKQASQAYARAMVICQKELPIIAKDAVNDQTKSKYSKLDTICKIITPIYTEHGFALEFGTADAKKDKHIRITCEITHEMGFSKHRELELPLDMTGIKGSVNKTEIHASGSTISYLRRYLTTLIFNIATGDDNDGNKPLPKLSPEQVSEISELIKGIDQDKFYAWLKSVFMADRLIDIPANSYDQLLKSVKNKIKA